MFARRLDRRELGFLNRHYASIHSENASISRLIRLLDRDDGIGRNGPLITRQKVISDPGVRSRATFGLRRPLAGKELMSGGIEPAWSWAYIRHAIPS